MYFVFMLFFINFLSLLFVYCFFFFYCFGAHRDLHVLTHSFPTRRSSDLHDLTPEQVAIYDAYADAFKIIHQNIEAALEAVNITGPEGTLNRNAKAAARSAFESNKQRFFIHLLTAMKCPTLIKAIERDLEASHAVVVQVVSTGEALLDRRLAEIPAAEWSDIAVDITPREYVLDYLAHSFPTQLFEVFSDADGNLMSRPVFDADGNPVVSREAVERRDRKSTRLNSSH